MAKLWVFGDSFCSCNENWIQTLYRKGKFSEIEVLGVSSSSLYYTLTELDEYKQAIQPEDSVIIGLTSRNRHFFQNIHFCNPYALIYNKKTRSYLSDIDKDILEAYKMYITYLHDDEHEENQHKIFMFYLNNCIIPKIKCKNVITFSTINKNEYEGLTYRGMFETIIDFFHNHLGFTEMTIEEILNRSFTANHWVDHPEYEEYFWKNYNTLFEQLWA